MQNLALDLGASGGKIAVSEYDGQTIKTREIHRFDNATVSIGESLYWDTGNIWDEFLAGVGIALADHPLLATIGVDTFSNDFALISEHGDLMAPIRSYRDPRVLRNQDAIYERMPKDILYGLNGNQIAPFNTFMQLAAMCLEGREELLKEAGTLLFLPDYFAYLLTGEKHTERSVASVSQMYDHCAKDWSGPVLNSFGLERRLFAPFIDAGRVVGIIEAGVLNNPLVHTAPHSILLCSVPGHDTASAFMAAQADPYTLVVSSGTWTIVGCETEGPVITDYGFSYNIANEGGIDGHHRLLRNLMGSWIIQEVRREYLSENGNAEWDYGAMAEAAAGLPAWKQPFDVDLPEFYSPGNMREKIIELCLKAYGSAPGTPAEFTASVCQSLALKTKWAADRLETLTGRRFVRVNIIGGGSHDLYTARLIADVTGLPVVCGPAEASLLGNIMFQLIAVGELAGVTEGRELLRKSVEYTMIEPKATEEAGEAYTRFCEKFGL